ncbi:glycoside hydrolase family 97 protein [Sunxiuqinia sp. A32]|uniref:glycoside hydrolase family 97 protein n=1 Tax=Sunxiuqinia sp. A32 TaxID=3461496 RepID=UPI004045D56F
MKITTKKLQRSFVIALCLIFSTASLWAAPLELKSPNGELKVNVDLNDKIVYSISYGQDVLLTNCSLQLNLQNESLGENPKLKNKKFSSINETIVPTIPLKNATIENNCNVLLLNFKNDYSVEFRAYDDGVAYRFITRKDGDVEVIDEDFGIEFPSTYLSHLSFTGSFKTSYEHAYSHVKTNEYKADDKMTILPVLLETDKQYKILISEADLSDYPCMFLKSTGNNGMQSAFPKCPLEFGDDGDRSLKLTKLADYIAKTPGTRNFPWRLFVISKEDKQLLENEMVAKLSTPNVLGDVSWIKPGQVSWDWWNAVFSPYGVDFKTGVNTATYKYYVDFASEFGIPYIILDEGWSVSTRDPFHATPDLDLPELIKYANEKNVKLVLWLTWLTVENNFDLFEKYGEWGIAGVKIDFMDRSDQWMVNYYERVAKEAAKYKLFVDFHGSFKPAGLNIAYPNVLSFEGVRGLEQGGGCRPENTIFLPFIRNAVGPMDFTPGAMINMQPFCYNASRPNNASVGTRVNQLSMFVIFESGLQMLADNPTLYYRERECTDFISSVPVTWDETKVLYAKVGEAVVVAKRKGDEWFVGGMTNDKGRTIDVSFDFLPDGKEFTLTSFEDGINADRQGLDYKKKTISVNNQTKLSITMARNGGWAGSLK